LRAWERWPTEGIPERPDAWLYTVARRIVLDQFKHRVVRRRVAPALKAMVDSDALEPDEMVSSATFDDELLKLMFTCCHPALALDVQVALTLRTLLDLSVEDIARAFLVAPDTMEQRLTRAKRKVREAGIPWAVPEDHELAPRLQGVLAVLYLVFNQGHSPTAGDAVVNRPLCREAIRTTRSLVRMLRGHAEALALLALLLLLDSHADARTDASGALVLLEDQDRSQWDKRAIDEGRALLEKALALQQAPGPFQIQAAIAALHAEAPSLDVTDWPQIVALYDHLVKLTDSDVVRVNRAVAIGLSQSADAGLSALDAIAAGEELERYQPYHAARAGLLYRAGRRDQALIAYRAAFDGARNGAVRSFLAGRIQELAR
jgi:RNA polymerase sigma-70 factor (ECF subfamily)